MFSHGRIAMLDSDIRTAWYRQEPFALSRALLASARMRARNRDSSSPRNGTGAQKQLFEKV
jgi:hypothetical protein